MFLIGDCHLPSMIEVIFGTQSNEENIWQIFLETNSKEFASDLPLTWVICIKIDQNHVLWIICFIIFKRLSKYYWKAFYPLPLIYSVILLHTRHVVDVAYIKVLWLRRILNQCKNYLKRNIFFLKAVKTNTTKILQHFVHIFKQNKKRLFLLIPENTADSVQ